MRKEGKKMNLDYKKTALRVVIMFLVMLFGSYTIFILNEYKDFTVIAANKGVYFFGAFMGLTASYIPQVFVEKKEK